MLSVLRIVTGLLFLEHGTQKLLGFPLSANPGPALFSLLGGFRYSRSPHPCMIRTEWLARNDRDETGHCMSRNNSNESSDAVVPLLLIKA